MENILNEVEELLQDQNTFEHFPYSFAEFIYYVQQRQPTTLFIKFVSIDILIEQGDGCSVLKIRDLLEDDDGNEFLIYIGYAGRREYNSININNDDTYHQIRQSVKQRGLWDLIAPYFPLHAEKETQLAFVNDIQFNERVEDYCGQSRLIIDCKCKLPLAEFMWYLSTTEAITHIYIGDLTIYNNNRTMAFKHSNFALHISNNCKDFTQIKRFIEERAILHAPFNDISLKFIGESEYRDATPSTLGLLITNQEIMVVIDTLQKYFIMRQEDPHQKLIDSLIELSQYKDNDIKVCTNLNLIEEISEGTITLKFNKAMNTKEFMTYVENIEDNFKDIELDLKTHIIISNNYLGFSRKKFQEIELIFYFGIYPVEVYYSAEGIGAYKVRLNLLRQPYMDCRAELKKWYLELFDDKYKTKEEMFEDIQEWINNLTTSNFQS